MAILTLDVPSRAMERTVTLKAYVPLEAMQEGDQLRTLYLLHGVNGSYSNWMALTNLFALAGTHNLAASSLGEKRLAIIIPSAGNGFYHPIPHKQDPLWQEAFSHKHDYEAFFGEELPSLMTKMLPLSPKKEDTMIAGLSMGGYGALLLGVKYRNTFGRCAGFSSALFTRKTKEELEKSGFYGEPAFLDLLLGDFEENRLLPEHDVLAAFQQAKEETGLQSLPVTDLFCGTEDGLLPLSRQLEEALTKEGIPHRYEEHAGAHTWTFWEWALKRELELWEEDLKKKRQ